MLTFLDIGSLDGQKINIQSLICFTANFIPAENFEHTRY